MFEKQNKRENVEIKVFYVNAMQRKRWRHISHVTHIGHA